MISSIRKTAYNCIASFKEAKKTGQIPLWLVTAYAIYIPVEDFVNGLIPVSSVRQLISFAPEVLFYGVGFLVVYHKFRFGGGLRKTPLDPILIALAIGILISIFGNGASPLGSFKNVRIHWRYISIFYIFVNINISHLQLSKLLNLIKTLGIIQAVWASIQYILPMGPTLSVSAKDCHNVIQAKNANCGTFGDNAILSGFLLVVFTIFLSGFYLHTHHLLPSNRQELFTGILFYFSLFSSKKRAALMVSLVIPLFLFWILKKRIFVIKYVWFGIAVVAAAILLPIIFPADPDPLAANAESADFSSFEALLDPAYWKANAENSRGWMIIVTVNALIKSGRLWFGFGPELGIVPRGIEAFLSDPEDMAQLHRNLFVFEDPYWFAIWAYFGLVGLILFWWVLIRLYKVSTYVRRFSPIPEEKTLALTLQILVITGLLYGFVERLFMLRSFSFYFWLIAGLVVNRYITKYNPAKLEETALKSLSQSKQGINKLPK
jgi:hypothetical protein